MSDDRRSRSRIMSDDARARQPRTPARGVSIPVHVDEELTPPPQMPPIGPDDDVRQQLRLLAEGLGSVHVAIGKVWNERGNADRIESIERSISGLGSSVSTWANEAVRHGEQIKTISTTCGAVVTYTESLREIVASTNAQIETFLTREWPRHQQLLERLEKSIDTVADRMTRLEAAVDRLSSNDAALTERISSIDMRVTALERVGLISHAAASERVKIFTTARAAVVTGAAVIGWLAAHLPGWLG